MHLRHFSPFFLLLCLGCLTVESARAIATQPYSSLERECLQLLNRTRQKPTSLIPRLREWKQRFQGKRVPLAPNVWLETREGVPAIDEAITALKRTKPVTKVRLWKPLTLAARDHARDHAQSGDTGHRGSDGSTPPERLHRYVPQPKQSGEDLFYGANATALDVVMGLIVDDGVSDRGHRKSLLDEVYRRVGIACGPHPKLGRMCVFVFST
jgi:uncharacterized protein YkwD